MLGENNKTIMVLVIVLFFIILLSGCTDINTIKDDGADTVISDITELADGSPVTGDVDKLKMNTYYIIESYDNQLDDKDDPYIPYYTYNSYWKERLNPDNPIIKIPDVFHPAADYYLVKGEVTNIDNTMMNEVLLTIRIYNTNWEYIEKYTASTIYLPPGKTWTFNFKLDNDFNPYISDGYPVQAKLSFEVTVK